MKNNAGRSPSSKSAAALYQGDGKPVRRKRDVRVANSATARPDSPGIRFLEARSSGLSSSRERLLRQILDDSKETFFLSSREMAGRYNVNTATIIRSIQALGYEKFADFAHDLREYFVTGITPYSAMKAAEETGQSVADRVLQSIDKDVANVSEFRSNLDPEKIVDIANRINLSQRIVILGIDYAASLAGSLAYGLVRLGYDADAPVGSSGVVHNRIKIMTPKDLLIAVSFGRGLRDTIEAVKNARRRNIPSFGITNGDTTPIAKYCDSYLVATIARTSFIDSYVAAGGRIERDPRGVCAQPIGEGALDHLRESEEEYTSSARWYIEANDGKG